MDISQLHYLYVEDDPLSRQVMDMILRNGIGADTITMFEDSIDFIAHLHDLDDPPDIILLDIHVEPISGFEMLALLRADATCASIPVVALTASVMNEEVQKLREAGFDGAISKPISVTTFPDLMRRVIAGEAVWHIG